MQTIKRYWFHHEGEFIQMMPKKAMIMDVQVWQGMVSMWAIVDTKAEHEMRKFKIIQTEDPIPEDDEKGYAYYATFVLKGLDYHLFEIVDKRKGQEDAT